MDAANSRSKIASGVYQGTHARSVKHFSPEIQGLRAVAVVLVLIFHFWPSQLPGGYVGVDVFFVLSGYLITGMIWRELLETGQLSCLDFYSRRLRRLMPLALAVLAVTFAAMFWFLPRSRWTETSLEIAASAIYMQNWMLAWIAGDYLAAEAAASPVQHYWSLSIEEQYYIAWPLIVIAVTKLSKRFGWPLEAGMLVSLTAVFLTSLAISVQVTSIDETRAYFVTHTRMWEIAMGGILAITIVRFQLIPLLRLFLFCFGILAILTAAFTFSDKTAFPGYAALLPTFGTVLIIVSGKLEFGLFRGLNAKWIRWIGDRSYSIYLWHWPILVFYLATGRSVGWLEGSAMLIITILISHFSYTFIEQRFRYPQVASERSTLALGTTAALLCALIPSTFAQVTNTKTDRQNLQTAEQLMRYPGPAALVDGVDVPHGVPFLPSLETLRNDIPVVYKGEGCHQNQRDSNPKHCILGAKDAPTTVAIFGDSHAAQWFPALARVSKKKNWRLISLTKSACPFARIEPSKDKPNVSCKKWRENVIRWLKHNHVDIVFTSQSRQPSVSNQELLSGIQSVWSELLADGIIVVGIEDTPRFNFEPGDCLSEDPSKCFATRDEALPKRKLEDAASSFPGLYVLDLTDGICGPHTCEAVVGNIIVLRDTHHLTATYSAALAPYFLSLFDAATRSPP